jgi:type VI secretion system protein ImpK
MTEPPADTAVSVDNTIRTLQPGGRKAAAAQAAPADPVMAPTERDETRSRVRAVAPPADEPPPGFDSFLTSGHNALLSAAVPLLLLAGRLRGQISTPEPHTLLQQSIQEVRAFEDRAKRAGVAEEDVLAARYALCTVVDEAVMNTPWGARSTWAGRSLLVTFHRESFGGEKFFHIVERVLKEPRRYLLLLELLHACLCLEFEGRYRVLDRGEARRNEIRQELFRCIQDQRGLAEADLSPHWKGVEDRRHKIVKLVPLWVVAAACCAMLLAAYIAFSIRLTARADDLHATLARVGLEPLYAAPAVPLPALGLRELLAPQIAQGLVSVTDLTDGRTVVTITVSELFASASEKVSSSYLELIAAIGAAANRVPGRYLIVGHTDDQPVRSFRFQDNYQLSRERAMHVVQLLTTRMKDASRLEFTGMGASEPRYKPASAPENRARNRRVEIVHNRNR